MFPVLVVLVFFVYIYFLKMFLKLFAVILISKKIIIRVLIYVAVGQISCGIIVYGRRFGLLREQWGRPWGLQWGGGGVIAGV